MLTTIFALTILGLQISAEQLVSAVFFALFLGSEALGNNPKVKHNSVYQFVLSYLKRSRQEDDKISAIRKILRK